MRYGISFQRNQQEERRRFNYMDRDGRPKSWWLVVALGVIFLLASSISLAQVAQ